MSSTKSILISIIVVVVVVLGVYVLLPNSTETLPTAENSAGNMGETSVENPVSENSPSSSTVTGGTYETYSVENLARANTGKVVLFFRASWCPTCRAVDADIHANLNSIPDNVTILDVNYDNSTDLKRKYGVTYQHTFVQVDANGNQIAKWSGSPTLASLLGKVK